MIVSKSLHAGYLFIILLSSDFFFTIVTFSMNTIIVPNSLDPDHDRLSVSPDLGPNSLQFW